MREIKLHLGALSESIEAQLQKQGLYLKPERLEFYEKLKQSILMCSFHVATQNQTDFMFKKFLNKILKEVKKIEK